jgi:hypothetical protein
MSKPKKVFVKELLLATNVTSPIPNYFTHEKKIFFRVDVRIAF